MAFYRCGGANHYDEGYTAGYNTGYPAGKTAQKNRGSTTDVRNAAVSDGSFSVTFPWRVDGVVDAVCHSDSGSFAGGIGGINISGSTVSGWIGARFFPEYVTITAKHFYSLDA